MVRGKSHDFLGRRNRQRGSLCESLSPFQCSLLQLISRDRLVGESQLDAACRLNTLGLDAELKGSPIADLMHE